MEPLIFHNRLLLPTRFRVWPWCRQMDGRDKRHRGSGIPEPHAQHHLLCLHRHRDCRHAPSGNLRPILPKAVLHRSESGLGGSRCTSHLGNSIPCHTDPSQSVQGSSFWATGNIPHQYHPNPWNPVVCGKCMDRPLAGQRYRMVGRHELPLLLHRKSRLCILCLPQGQEPAAFAEHGTEKIPT